MIEDSKCDKPKFNGMVDGVKKIIAEEGWSGVYRGVGPVVRAGALEECRVLTLQMLRQGANSAVRFSSYSTLKQLAQGSMPAGTELPGWMTFGIGSCAGIITVYTTMPFE